VFGATRACFARSMGQLCGCEPVLRAAGSAGSGWRSARIAASKPGHGLALDGSSRDGLSRGGSNPVRGDRPRPVLRRPAGGDGHAGVAQSVPRAAGFTRRYAAPLSVRPEKNRCCTRPSLYCVKLGRISHVISVSASTFRWAHRHRLCTSHTADNRFP